MRDAELSGWCTRTDHDRCPHWAGMRMPLRPWRRPTSPDMVLCRCPCHAECPLADERSVLRELWDEQCVCPGAEVARASLARSAERREEVGRIVGDVDFSDHPDAEEIENRLRAVFTEHGTEPPPGLTGWARIIAAGKAPRGTRLPRLLGMGGRAVASTVRWSHAPASSDGDAQNRSQTRSGYRAVGVVATVAMALTVAAVVSTGWRRLLWGLTASVAWLLSGYAVSLVTAVAGIGRAAESSSRAQDLRSR